jgi:hypothetical protein
VGSHSIKATAFNHNINQYIWYPKTGVLDLDLTKIGGIYKAGSINFFVRADWPAGGILHDCRVHLQTGSTAGANSFYYDIKSDVASELFPSFSLPVANYNPSDYSKFNGWVDNGGDWTQIDKILFDWNIVAEYPCDNYLYVDGLCFNGSIIRGAKKSGESYYKTKKITDDLAKDDTVKTGVPGTTDVGTLATLAKAELYKCGKSWITGSFRVPMQPNILAGQLVHVHACKKSDGSFAVDKDMRVTLHHLTFCSPMPFSDLTVTDDVSNGIPVRSVIDPYNYMLKMVNPESQTRQISSIKSRDIDVSQDILEETYTF